MNETDLISRQDANDAINGLIDRFERILRDIRELKIDDSVCGMCEYDGAYMGQSGDWCNECPGFEKDDCFKLSEECKKRWLDSVNLPSVQPERKKGKWVRITQGAMPEQYICPFCHRTVEAYGVEELLSIRYPYCHCGADMRGEKNVRKPD